MTFVIDRRNILHTTKSLLYFYNYTRNKSNDNGTRHYFYQNALVLKIDGNRNNFENLCRGTKTKPLT